VSEELLHKILDQLQVVQTQISGIGTEVVTLKSEVAALKSEVTGIKPEVAALKSEFAEIKNDLNNLKLAVKRIEERQVQMEYQQNIIYEQVAKLTEFKTETQSKFSDLEDNINYTMFMVAKHEAKILAMRNREINEALKGA